MAHFVDEGVEGSETGIAKAATDINQWLESNRLDKLKDYFENSQIEMDDLMSFSETDFEFRFVYTILKETSLKLCMFLWRYTFAF